MLTLTLLGKPRVAEKTEAAAKSKGPHRKQAAAGRGGPHLGESKAAEKQGCRIDKSCRRERCRIRRELPQGRKGCWGEKLPGRKAFGAAKHLGAEKHLLQKSIWGEKLPRRKASGAKSICRREQVGHRQKHLGRKAFGAKSIWGEKHLGRKAFGAKSIWGEKRKAAAGKGAA